MERTTFVSECQKIFSLNQLACTEDQANLLYDLTVRMLEVNRVMNLTAITEEKTIILRHYVDSLAISKEIPMNSRVIDVGCGAGFPTLPLAIFRPDLRIVALDGTAKRIHYVEETAKLLGLSGVTAIAGRAEELAQKAEYRESFDVVTARAVAALPMLSELCLGFARVGGKMLAMKSQQVEEEIVAAASCIAICGGKIEKTEATHLTADGENLEQRTLVLIQKIKNTPQKYPRHFSKISKNPL